MYFKIYLLYAILRRTREFLMPMNGFSSKVKPLQPGDVPLKVLLLSIPSFMSLNISIKSQRVISMSHGKYVPVWFLLPISSVILDKLFNI